MEIKFWKEKAKGYIDPDLFSNTAETWAKKVFEADASGKKNKPTQLRKFYDEVIKLESILLSVPSEKKQEEFNVLLPYLKMLNAKVRYAEGRDLITSEFRDFINKSIDQINDLDDFNAFSSFFEAFMGFYKFYDEKGERQNIQQKDNRSQNNYQQKKKF